MATEGREIIIEALLIADVEKMLGVRGIVEPFFAGTWSPDKAIAIANPAVLSATVLPPVFGPVRMRPDWP